MISKEAFGRLCGYETAWDYSDNQSDLPCFAHRVSVHERVDTPDRIRALIKYGSEQSKNDVIIFSVTEQDACWRAWSEYAKAHPKTFKVVEGGSIHGRYMCRMYIYTKPASKRMNGAKKGK